MQFFAIYSKYFLFGISLNRIFPEFVIVERQPLTVDCQARSKLSDLTQKRKTSER